MRFIAAAGSAPAAPAPTAPVTELQAPHSTPARPAPASGAGAVPKPAVTWRRKDLLSLEELSRAEIELLLRTAESFKEVSAREVKKVPALRGKTIANLFFESSTRTRTSFELAAKRLSADTINFQGSTSSVQKGESLIDTAKNIEAMQVDTVVVRHASSGAAELLARELDASVVNAGDGIHEHPTQGLLDIFTIREHLPLAGPARVPGRRHPPLARGALQPVGVAQARRAGDGVRPADADSAWHRAVGRHGLLRPR